MSGSGGGGGGDFGSYGTKSNGGSKLNCNIIESVPLNSVQPAVLPKLTIGLVLDVELQAKALVARLQNKGPIAGALTPGSLAALIACIGAGNEYIAVVVKVKGALVEVEIRPK